MRELKVGDRVTVLVSQGDELPAGATGTVMSLDDPAVKLAGGVGKACILRSDKPYLAGSGNFCSAWIVSLHDLGFLDTFVPGDRVRLKQAYRSAGLPKDAVGTVISCEIRAAGQQYCVVAMDEMYCYPGTPVFLGKSVFNDKYTFASHELEYVYKPVYDGPKPVAKAHRLITKRRRER